ncbi:Uncharacterised protein [Mycobacteroides abscessus]|nr:Uncharacterised protein [Mycobacteroides abscessus]
MVWLPWPWKRSIDSWAPGGIEPSALRTRKMPAMPPSEWNWTWQWYIHAPGPTPSPATTWNPNASPGLRSRLSTTWLGSYWSASRPVRLFAQRCAWRWKVWSWLPWPMQMNSTRSPSFASNIGVSGATLLLMVMSLKTIVNCFCGSTSPTRRTTSAP